MTGLVVSLESVNWLAMLGQAGAEIWTVTILGGLLPCPGPGPVNRSTGLFVLPELVTRLAVLVKAGPAGWKVTITDQLVVLFVRMTVICISMPSEPVMWECSWCCFAPDQVR